ncbi:hypothetical protein V866_001785 [Kwoniella sp. B9012]
MPKSLLDLTDELLQHVAFYLHTDNFIPLLSFHPHHFNWASEINPGIQKDYMRFRSTCRRVNELCPPKGLHVVLKKWDRLVDWTVKAPDSVLAGVRRLVLDVPPKVSMSLHTAWRILTRSLELLTNLEELTLLQTPLCPHKHKVAPHYGRLSLNEVPIYTRDFLPRLKSFSISVRCDYCHEKLEHMFIAAIPLISTLKTSGFFLVEGADTEWSDFHDDTTMPLKTIYTKVCHIVYIIVEAPDSLEDIGNRFPDLETLVVSRYEVEDVNGCHTRAQSMTDWEWGLEYECSEGLNYNIINFVTNGYEDHWDYLVRFLKNLGTLKKLKTLDIVMIFTIKDRRPSPGEYSKEIRCSDIHNGPNKAHQKIQEYESKLRSAMSKAAIPFLEHIPSLETGYFWEPHGPFKPTG